MKKEKKAAKPKAPRKAKPKKEPVSQWAKNPLNETVLDYHNYEMTQSEKVLYFVLAFLVGGIVSQFFYGGLFKEDGAPTLLTYISNAAAFVVVGLIAGKVFGIVWKKISNEDQTPQPLSDDYSTREVLFA